MINQDKIIIEYFVIYNRQRQRFLCDGDGVEVLIYELYTVRVCTKTGYTVRLNYPYYSVPYRYFF